MCIKFLNKRPSVTDIPLSKTEVVKDSPQHAVSATPNQALKATPHPAAKASAPVTPRSEARRNILHTFSYRSTAPAKPDDIPPDNIFVPIQKDDILPHIPIGDHHPVPRKGIENSDDRALHTNSFYANAFLGAQNQPIWTHPYSLWWGKGSLDPGTLQTWGINVGHVEEGDFQYGEGEPPKVRWNEGEEGRCLLMF